ncbi:hypothetical protein GA0115245_10031, partial [Streptomyces sp. di188]
TATSALTAVRGGGGDRYGEGRETCSCPDHSSDEGHPSKSAINHGPISTRYDDWSWTWCGTWSAAWLLPKSHTSAVPPPVSAWRSPLSRSACSGSNASWACGCSSAPAVRCGSRRPGRCCWPRRGRCCPARSRSSPPPDGCATARRACCAPHCPPDLSGETVAALGVAALGVAALGVAGRGVHPGARRRHAADHGTSGVAAPTGLGFSLRRRPCRRKDRKSADPAQRGGCGRVSGRGPLRGRRLHPDRPHGGDPAGGRRGDRHGGADRGGRAAGEDVPLVAMDALRARTFRSSR